MKKREAIGDGARHLIASGLHLGRISSGARLRSARQTARDVGTDYRTVLAALRALELDGLVEIRPRGGVYAGCKTPGSGAQQAIRFGERLLQLVSDEIASGLSLGAVAERLRQSIDPSGLRAACLECNQDQLCFLCEELRVAFGLESSAVEIDRLRGGPPLVVRQADVLVSTTFHAGEVRRCAARLGKPALIVTLDPRRRTDVTRLLKERPVCFIGTDPRWAAKVRAIWAGEPGIERFRALTIGCDSLADIREDEAVMLMPLARKSLAGTQLAARALPHRGFSLDATRQILGFLIRTNTRTP